MKPRLSRKAIDMSETYKQTLPPQFCCCSTTLSGVQSTQLQACPIYKVFCRALGPWHIVADLKASGDREQVSPGPLSFNPRLKFSLVFLFCVVLYKNCTLVYDGTFI